MIHQKSKKKGAKAVIRVIKKAEIATRGTPISDNKQPNKEGARRLVANVMNWISDLEPRKLKETRLATERFQHT